MLCYQQLLCFYNAVTHNFWILYINLLLTGEGGEEGEIKTGKHFLFCIDMYYIVNEWNIKKMVLCCKLQNMFLFILCDVDNQMESIF